MGGGGGTRIGVRVSRRLEEGGGGDLDQRYKLQYSNEGQKPEGNLGFGLG